MPDFLRLLMQRSASFVEAPGSKPMSEYGARGVTDFCKWAGISRTTFYKEVKAGRLKTLKVGKTTLVRDSDGVAWLDSLPARDAILKVHGKKRGRKPSAHSAEAASCP